MMRLPREFIDDRAVVVRATPEHAFVPVRRIGGDDGWYYADGLWTARRTLLRLLGGRPASRARRDPDDCRVGDLIDGWRVDSFEPERRLRLETTEGMPGRGWLDFQVRPIDGERTEIRQTATFAPRGLFGYVYWLTLIPLHAAVFRGMLRGIATRADGSIR